MLLNVYVVFSICFKRNHEQIHVNTMAEYFLLKGHIAVRGPNESMYRKIM